MILQDVPSGQIFVRSPFHKPISEIHEIVRKKAGWILKKQLEYKNQNPEIMKPNFQDSSTLPYSGKNYALKIIANYQGSEKVEFENGEFSIYIKGECSKKKARLLYEKCLTEAAQSLLDKKIKEYSKELSVESQQIKLKTLKRRWGSLTKDGTINLSIDLLKAPTDVIDYILLYELCHLRIKCHSHRFWDLVHKFMPSYEDKIHWLKVNGLHMKYLHTDILFFIGVK